VRGVGQRRSIWVGVCVLVVFFAGVTLAFAWLGGGPGVPHSVAGDRAACLTCHPVDGLPESHHDRVNDGCPSCHSAKSADASARGVGPDGVELADVGSL
jgi:hypothetical protein